MLRDIMDKERECFLTALRALILFFLMLALIGVLFGECEASERDWYADYEAGYQARQQQIQGQQQDAWRQQETVQGLGIIIRQQDYLYSEGFMERQRTGDER